MLSVSISQAENVRSRIHFSVSQTSRLVGKTLRAEYSSSVPHKSFAFGGKTGTTVCTVAFRKEMNTDPSPLAKTSKNGQAGDRNSSGLYICIDVSILSEPSDEASIR